MTSTISSQDAQDADRELARAVNSAEALRSATTLIPPLPEIDPSARPHFRFRLSQRVAADLFALTDLMSIAASAAVVMWFAEQRGLASAARAHDLLLIAPPVAVIAVLAFTAAGLHQMQTLMHVARQASRLLVVWALVAIAVGIGLSAFYSGPLLVFLAWLCLTPAALLASRMLLTLFYLVLLKRGPMARRVALIGASPSLQSAAELVTKDRLMRLVATFELPTELNVLTLPRSISDLMDSLGSAGFDDVIVLVPSTAEHGLDALIDHLAMLPLRIALLPVVALQTLDEVRPGDCDALSVTVAEKPVRGWSIIFKAVFDYVTALAMLALFAIPMLVIAIAIKLESPGPVIFKQQRTGLGGRVFRIWKFRSMHVLEDGSAISQATRKDERVTRVGRIIRRLSLDELPQIFNVLSGDMSVIGPRPHARAHDAYYARLIADYRLRFRVKPGISGWAQIHGCRGETRTIDDMARRVSYDIQYAVGYSFWRDVYVVLMTPFFGILSSNSY